MSFTSSTDNDCGYSRTLTPAGAEAAILEYAVHKTVFAAAVEGDAGKLRASLSGQPASVINRALHQPRHHGMMSYSALSIAAYHGHLEVVQLLVNSYNVDMNQKEGCSSSNIVFCPALVSAAMAGHLDVVKFLVTKGCDLNIHDSCKHTPLFEACLLGNLDLVKYLVDKGANIEAADQFGRTCLMASCTEAKVKVAQFLLAEGADPNREKAGKVTALHIAVLEDATQVVKLLLEKGARLTKDEDDFSPLTLAAAGKSAEIVEIFLESSQITRKERIDALELLGAQMAIDDVFKAFRYLRRAMVERHIDPDHVISKPCSPLPMQSGLEESRTLEELETRWLDQSTLHLECLAIVERSLGHSSYITVETHHSYLQMFQNSGQCSQALAVCLHLMKTPHKHCAYTCSNRDSTFFDIAGQMLKKGQPVPFLYIHEFLALTLEKIKQNANISRSTLSWASTSFLYATLLGIRFAHGQEEGRQLQDLVKNLVGMKAFQSGESPLRLVHVAVAMYCASISILAEVENLPYVSLVTFLLQCGADVHARDDDGNRPLHVIAFCPEGRDSRETQRCIIRTLLRAGALVGVKNRRGETPLDCAVAETVKSMLREHYPPSLKSIAANIVVKEGISFVSEIPEDLNDFVHLHSVK